MFYFSKFACLSPTKQYDSFNSRDRNNNKDNLETPSASCTPVSAPNAVTSFRSLIDTMFNYLFSNVKSKSLREKFERLVVLTRSLMLHNNDLNKRLSKSFEKLKFYNQQRKFISDNNLILTPINDSSMMGCSGSSIAKKETLMNKSISSGNGNVWLQINDNKAKYSSLAASTGQLRYFAFFFRPNFLIKLFLFNFKI